MTVTVIPQSIEEAIIQAKSALQIALESGCTRITIDLVIPEIALKAQYLAQEFADFFSEYGAGLKLFFPDTGAAALARRDWGETEFQVTDIGSSRSPIERKISDTDQVFLVISPSAVEVNLVEKLCNIAGDRPVILLIPQLEDVSIVGIGYAARQLRERFISILESAYYFRPLESAVVLRSYPQLWQVWQQNEENEDYELIAEVPQKPLGENLDRILQGQTEDDSDNNNNTPPPSASGLFASLKSFLKALNN
ncbi:DUF1995 family protein [Cyanobacterium aponinum AL20118]|uniref:DUF1995 family protein n=1 Tax=Cyanobacterium aponinum AL20115 TaxID=3090662 RepID=A0AAF0ZDX1_9CHRO|nr:DUF1995 family protein [Cyanobacterium aponinum]WPF90123.1 DUF1995 family protein [Cyanobacterium aponinum AL20115]WRL37777.1 DUF1995 family protein [Cyanobacterium aponinum UTEX 3221]